MSQVKKGSRVKILYTGKLKDGSVFETNVGDAPLEFTVGKGKVPWFASLSLTLEQGHELVLPL